VEIFSKVQPKRSHYPLNSMPDQIRSHPEPTEYHFNTKPNRDPNTPVTKNFTSEKVDIYGHFPAFPALPTPPRKQTPKTLAFVVIIPVPLFVLILVFPPTI